MEQNIVIPEINENWNVVLDNGLLATGIVNEWKYIPQDNIGVMYKMLLYSADLQNMVPVWVREDQMYNRNTVN